MSDIIVAAKPVQLIINGTVYPHTSHDKYSYAVEPFGKEFTAISGRRFFERRGMRSVVSYAYDYFQDDLRVACLTDLRSTGELTVSYLNDITNEMVTEQMYVATRPSPTYAFARSGKGYWHDYAFVLKGVRPLA